MSIFGAVLEPFWDILVVKLFVVSLMHSIAYLQIVQKPRDDLKDLGWADFDLGSSAVCPILHSSWDFGRNG